MLKYTTGLVPTSDRIECFQETVTSRPPSLVTEVEMEELLRDVLSQLAVRCSEYLSLTPTQICPEDNSTNLDIMRLNVCRREVVSNIRHIYTRSEKGRVSLCYTYLLTYGAEPFLRSCQLCSPSRTPQHFMERENSIPCSQEPSTGPYPEPYQSNPLHPVLSL
jgi:hypothetical protein